VCATTKRKPYDIDKRLVSKAYRLVKANAGAAGVDQETIEQFEKDLKGNLYKIWNRMSSGSYLPPPVRAVPIPKKDGGQRILGVPTVADRVAQTVVKMVIEPNFEKVFLPDSYGYRPRKSALDAVGVTRKRCWTHDWILEFDIKGLFDNISHSLLLKAVRKHVRDEWAILYIERWLTAPMQLEDGTRLERDRGTPQGGVVSPVLANLFMHYVFDAWMQREYPALPWCRYADDGLVHCRTLKEAEALKAALQKRLAECGLEMHSGKTSIVYCKDGKRSLGYAKTSFDFLGFTFRPRKTWNRRRRHMFTGFLPAVSGGALKSMRTTIKDLRLAHHSETELEDIARKLNPILRGWIAYYGHYCPEALKGFYRHIDHRLMLWARRKYSRLCGSRTRAGSRINQLRRSSPRLFAHWSIGCQRSFCLMGAE
jgi:RNA-directed DNA polymerase